MPFGIDNLTRAVRALEANLTQRINALAMAVGTHMEATDAALCRLEERLTETQEKIMASVQELTEALNELDGAITEEIQEINTKLDQLANQQPDLQPQVDAIKAATGRIQGIVADAVPEPPPAGGRK